MLLIRDDSMLPSFSFSANFFLRLIYLGSWLLSICFLFSFSASWISFLLVSGMHWVISWVYIRQPVFFQPRDLGRVFWVGHRKNGFQFTFSISFGCMYCNRQRDLGPGWVSRKVIRPSNFVFVLQQPRCNLIDVRIKASNNIVTIDWTKI